MKVYEAKELEDGARVVLVDDVEDALAAFALLGLISDETLRFWLATRHIQGFDAAADFCRRELDRRKQ